MGRDKLFKLGLRNFDNRLATNCKLLIKDLSGCTCRKICVKGTRKRRDVYMAQLKSWAMALIRILFTSVIRSFISLSAHLFCSQSQLDIFVLLRSDALLSSPRPLCFAIRDTHLTSSFHLGWQGSFTSIHKLCSIMQDIMTYFKLNRRHSVFLYKSLQRPFSTP